MTRRTQFALRLAAGLALLAALSIAVFGVVLWSDPESAILSLRGSPHAVVRSEPIPRGELLLENSRITTSSELEVELLVLRPSEENASLLLLVGVDSNAILDLVSELPVPRSCAVALVACEYPSEGLFDLRASTERAAASFLAATEFLRGESWYENAPVHFAGREISANVAWLAASLDSSVRVAWNLGGEVEPPSGLQDRVAHELAFGGHRRPEWRSPQPTGSSLTEALEWIETRIAGEDPGSPRRSLQPRAR